MACRERPVRSRQKGQNNEKHTSPTPLSDPELGKKKRAPVVNCTFNSSTVSSIDVEDKLFDSTKGLDQDDGPVVFICGKCKSPIGDSLSWDGCEDEQNQIRLKKVTDNVLVGKESRMYEVGKDTVCLITDVLCRACHSVLGMVYTSTPKELDHKRFAFCFNVADIDSYVLGTATQTRTAEGTQEQPVTMEYTDSVEEQIEEMKILVLSMSQRLEELEAGFVDVYDEV